MSNINKGKYTYDAGDGPKTFAWREYRPGKFQIIYSHHGKQIFRTKDLYRRPLLSIDQIERCCETLAANEDIRDPQTGKQFQFETAVNNWTDTSQCSTEWLANRKYIAKNHLIPFFQKMHFRDITTVDVNSFEKALRDKKLSTSTIRNIVSELRTFLRAHEDSVRHMPKFHNIKVQLPAIRYLTPDQQTKVFDLIPAHHAPIFSFLRYYPVRPGEACGLQWKNVFKTAETPYFVIAEVVRRSGDVVPFTKTKRARPYPIHPDLAHLFEKKGDSDFVFTFNGKPYTDIQLYQVWIVANKKAGVPRVSLYQGLKHSRGWGLVEDGVSIEDVSLLMGHTGSGMTRRYAGQTLKRMLELLGPVHRKFIGSKKRKLAKSNGNTKKYQDDGH